MLGVDIFLNEEQIRVLDKVGRLEIRSTQKLFEEGKIYMTNVGNVMIKKVFDESLGAMTNLKAKLSGFKSLGDFKKNWTEENLNNVWNPAVMIVVHILGRDF